MSSYEDRLESKERAWGARIGVNGTVGIAAVLPIDHPKAEPPGMMLEILEKAAKAIDHNLHHKAT
jgi:hypothetical protein